MTKTEIFNLYDHLRFLGFSPEFILGGALEKLIFEDRPAFELSTTVSFDEHPELKADLYFVKSEEMGVHFLQKYRATLHHPDDLAMAKSQTFSMTDGIQVKLNEAYNLLQGRAVFKEIVPPKGDRYNAWLQLNFKEKETTGDFKLVKFRSYYGFELANMLNKYPIRELADIGLKEVIVQSLKAGDRRIVTFLKPSGKTEKKIIAANPMFKTINIFAMPKTTQRLAK